MRITEKQIATNEDMSEDIESTPQQVYQQFGYSIQANYSTSGTLAGTLQLECSLDFQKDGNGNILNAGTWIPIADSQKVISESDAPLSYVWNVRDPNYPWVRVTYAADPSDTGLLNVFYYGRGF